MSTREKVIGFFTAPSQLLGDICESPLVEINWRFPLLVFLVVTLALRQWMLADPVLLTQMQTKIAQEIDTAITSSQMSQQEAEQTRTFATPGSAPFEIFLGFLMVIAVVLLLFGLSLIYWLLGRLGMNSDAPFIKVVELVSITFFVNTIEGVVTAGLMVATHSITATPSLAVFVPGLDPESTTFLALTMANPFRVWDLALTSIGLSYLFQRDLPKVAVIVFALWIVWSVATVLVGIRLA
jgi:hypothetical protein